MSEQIDLSEPTYAEMFQLDPEDFLSIKIKDCNLGIRVENRFMSHKIFTVRDLLLCRQSDLLKFSGFGKTSISIVEDYLQTLSGHPALPKSSPKQEEIEEVLGEELIKKIEEGDPAVFAIFGMLSDFCQETEQRHQFEAAISNIPEQRLSLPAKMVIKAYKDSDTDQKELSGKLSNESLSLRDFFLENAADFSYRHGDIALLAKWCEFDVREEIRNFFEIIVKNKRALEILEGRATGKTLEALGTIYELTRERIRQIEKKYARRFNVWMENKRILPKIFLDLGESNALLAQEIIDYLGRYGTVFVYLVKTQDSSPYDPQLDLIILEQLPLTDKIQAFIDNLPEAFNAKKLDGFVEEIVESFGCPEKMARVLIDDSYQRTGDVCHRSRLTLRKVYGDILKRFYPEGMHLDEIEIERFREISLEHYGIDLSDKSSRSIIGILGSIGLLCDRGTYRYYEPKAYISKSLAQEIHDFIAESDQPIFLFRTIFLQFEDRLIAEGVGNRYYLGGILKILFGEEWIFRRDYVSKDPNFTTIYSSIISLIKRSPYPVAREEIFRELPGISDIMLYVATTDTNIINLYGSWIHSSRLKFEESEIAYLKSIVEEKLVPTGICNFRDVYEYVVANHPQLLANNFVVYPSNLYGILEYLFRDSYNFSRPFIANFGVKIDRIDDLLLAMVQETEITEIEDLLEFTKEHHVSIYRILDLLNSFNGTHLLMNARELASISYLGINEEIAREVEALILEEIHGPTPICRLECVPLFPTINVPWNAWLVYSVLNKWSDQLVVATSNSQFRLSYPLVAPLGTTEFPEEDPNISHDGELVQADDLSNLDDLIADYILEELGDLSEFSGFAD